MNGHFDSRTEKTRDDWETPPYFFNLLNNIFNFTLDPCSSKDNHLCEKYYTEEDNGLKQDWGGEIAFVNPPYKYIKAWVKKCYQESVKPNTTVVMLIPNRTDTEYWHNYIWKAHEVWLCKKRVLFLIDGKDYFWRLRDGEWKRVKSSPTSGSVIVVFKSYPKKTQYPIFKPFQHR
jgi:phage N-6-adenine-methyltransferase